MRPEGPLTFGASVDCGGALSRRAPYWRPGRGVLAPKSATQKQVAILKPRQSPEPPNHIQFPPPTSSIIDIAFKIFLLVVQVLYVFESRHA